MFLVVTIHVSGQTTNVWGQISKLDWLIGDIFGGVARVSVPLFFMISGFLLLPRSESIGSFYRKRMPKVVIPFVAWSVIYLFSFCSGQASTCTPDYLWQFITLQRSYFHLWFLYSLITIYFIIPVLRLMIRPDTDKKVLWYLMGLWMLFQPGWATTTQFFHFEINIRAPMATGFLPYFLLGYLLGEMPLSRFKIILSSIIFAVGSLVTIAGTFFLTQSSGQFNGFFYDFVSIGVIPASGAAFLLLRGLSEKPVLASDRMHSIIRDLSTGSFGVYLVHVLVINGLGLLHLTTLIGSPIWTIPLITVLVFAISYVITRGLQRIPVVKHIVPG